MRLLKLIAALEDCARVTVVGNNKMELKYVKEACNDSLGRSSTNNTVFMDNGTVIEFVLCNTINDVAGKRQDYLIWLYKPEENIQLSASKMTRFMEIILFTNR